MVATEGVGLCMCRFFIPDIDECDGDGTNNCSSDADCTDTIGIYDCTCRNGFIGDGFTCEGIPLVKWSSIANYILHCFGKLLRFIVDLFRCG